MSRGYYGSNGEGWPHGGTPDWLLEQIIEEFGQVFDPCPNHADFDGLAIDWPTDGTWTYCNPPYARGQISRWVEKCANEWRKGAKVILLIPAYTDTKYFHDEIYPYAKLRFLRGRLKFKGYGGKSASFPSMLCIWGVNA